MSESRTLRFVRRGEVVTLQNVPPDRTLLDLLREDLHAKGTKEGCGEGDCGACAVVLGESVAQDSGAHALRCHTTNSCIRLAHSIDGKALWTVEDLAADPTLRRLAPQEDDSACSASAPAAACVAKAPAPLHPAQQAMVDHHGSQCGFCTPGFVMSLFAMYQNHVVNGRAITREMAQNDLSGNLCRCTGYRPIFDAAQAMGSAPRVAIDAAQLLQKLELISHTDTALEAFFSYKTPTSLAALLAARAAQPQAQVVAGCTDVGLWITRQHRQFAHILDVTRAKELRRIDRIGDPRQAGAEQLRVGAAVSLTDAFDALHAVWPHLRTFTSRFAGLPVRNTGTLGGNIANGSPIGDSMPLLIALRAQVVLASVQGERTLELESLYTGYRTNAMAADELLIYVLIPAPPTAATPAAAATTAATTTVATTTSEPDAQTAATAPPHKANDDGIRLGAYKISKRTDDDISAVCLAIRLHIVNGVVQDASIGVGGVAPTPVRAALAEAALRDAPWNKAAMQRAAQALQTEFQPISDMRASGDYRRHVLGSLALRFWREHGGAPTTTPPDARSPHAVGKSPSALATPFTQQPQPQPQSQSPIQLHLLKPISPISPISPVEQTLSPAHHTGGAPA